jgi:hypothetical protein
MRIVLQQKDSGLYFKDIDAWVRNSAQAKDFVSSSAAIDFCVANKLNGLQLVLKFEDQRYEIVLPIARLAEPPHPREAGQAPLT